MIPGRYRIWLLRLLHIVVLTGLSASASAFDNVINVPGDPVPTSIGSDTQLNLSSGGNLRPFFEAGATDGSSTNVELNVTGGTVAGGFKAYSGSTVNISGGLVEPGFTAETGSTINVTGGNFSNSFLRFNPGSTINILSGTSGLNLGAFGTTNILGGHIETIEPRFSGETPNINISGGTYSDDIVLLTTNVQLSGDEFRIDGIPVAGLDTIGQSVSFNLSSGQELSGTLSDGSTFAFMTAEELLLDTLPSNSHANFTLLRTSVPQIESTVINLPTADSPIGLRAGQTVNVPSGGSIRSNFNAIFGSEVNLVGGSIGRNFEASGATVNVSAGYLDDHADAFADSIWNLTGGTIGEQFSTFNGSQINLSGSNVGYLFSVQFGSQVDVTGGAIGDFFETDNGSNVEISGGDFRLDGVPISGLSTLGSTQQLDLPDNSLLTGTLSDGTPFAFTSSDRHFVQVTPSFGATRSDSFSAGTLTLRSDMVSSGPSNINIPGAPAPLGVADGQTLVLNSGGILADNFGAGWNSEVHIQGGEVGNNFEVVGANVTVSGGTIGERMDVFLGSTVTVTSGAIGDHLQVHPNATVNISSGIIGDQVEVRGAVTISDGEIGDRFLAGGNVAISGGRFGDQFRVPAGTTTEEVLISGGTFGENFQTLPSFVGGTASKVTFLGSDFRLDNVPITGLEFIGNSVSVNIPQGSVISGTFADGTPFAFTSQDPVFGLGIGDQFVDGSLTLERAEVEVGPAMITIPTEPAPLGVADGQTMLVQSNGMVSDDFNAGRGSVVNVLGGAIGRNFEAFGAQVTISDGSIYSHADMFIGTNLVVNGGSVGKFLEAFNGSKVTITDGSIGLNFTAYADSVVNVLGGVIADRFDAREGATVNISGGEIGDYFDAFDGSVVTITNGTIGKRFEALSGSTINISGGSIGEFFQAYESSVVNISGGTFGESFFAFAGSEINISGGEFGEDFNALSNSTINISGGTFGIDFDAMDHSEVTIVGTDFVLDDINLTSSLQPGVPFELTFSNRVDKTLSGVLADGSAFSFFLGGTELVFGPDEPQGQDSFASQARLFVILEDNSAASASGSNDFNKVVVPEPSSIVLVAKILAIMSCCSRRKMQSKMPASEKCLTFGINYRKPTSYQFAITLFVLAVFTMLAAVKVHAQVEHTIFVTGGTFGVNSVSEPNPVGNSFGGLSSADFQVTQAAAFAGLLSDWNGQDRIWNALISTSQIDIRDRVSVEGRVINTRGEIIAFDHADLWDGTIENAINYNELAQLIPGDQAFYTGSDAFGRNSSLNCQDWQSNFQLTAAGFSDETVSWTNRINLTCSQSIRLVALSPPQNVLSGDYDRNGQVTAEDLSVWENHFASTVNVLADGDFDNDVDGADFLLWQRQLGTTSASVAATTVPEPSTGVILITTLIVCFVNRVRK